MRSVVGMLSIVNYGYIHIIADALLMGSYIEFVIEDLCDDLDDIRTSSIGTILGSTVEVDEYEPSDVRDAHVRISCNLEDVHDQMH